MAKSMAVGIILAILFGGIGLMYAGKVGLGIILFILQVLCAVIGGILSVVLIGIPILIVGVILWIITLVLTAKTINEANGTKY